MSRQNKLSTEKLNSLLLRLYTTTNEPSAFSGVYSLYREAKKINKAVTLVRVREWLSKQRTYVLHRSAVRKQKRQRIFVQLIDEQWQIDLMDMRRWSAHNDEYTFLLMAIDMFSKYGFIRPLKSKHAVAVVEALRDIFNETNRLPSHRIPYKIQSDQGTEFTNEHVQRLLKDNNVHYFTVSNPDVKAMIVERWIRTMRDRIYRYMTHTDSPRYIDVLQELLHGYNTRKHRTIHMSPANVTYKNEKEVYLRTYSRYKYLGGKKLKFKIGDLVVIQREKDTRFQKGASYNWTEEYFRIQRAIQDDPNYYKLEDMAGEDITGNFMRHDLQKIIPTRNTWLQVDKVIKHRRNVVSKQKESLVSYKGWPRKFNTWIPSADVKTS